MSRLDVEKIGLLLNETARAWRSPLVPRGGLSVRGYRRTCERVAQDGYAGFVMGT